MKKSIFYVLVCLDDHADEKQVMDQLENCGEHVDVSYATSATEAECLLRSASYDLVIHLAQQFELQRMVAWADFFQHNRTPSVLLIQNSGMTDFTSIIMLLKYDNLSELIKDKLVGNGEISALQETLIKEKERERIAREIHDALGNDLMAIGLEFDCLLSNLVLTPEEQERAGRIKRMLSSVSASIRKIAQDLRPDILRDFGLIDASRKVIEDYRQNTELLIQFESNVKVVRLDEDKSLALYRLLQEAFVNIIKHAFATEVKVTLTCLPTEISLCVSDNGVGITEIDLDKPKSIGLKAMRERIAMFGGGIQFSSPKSGGFCILSTLPLP